VRIGADTGGTFTDLVAEDGQVVKVLSTREDPGQALREGLSGLAGSVSPELLAHGTTVATNTLLQRRGARVALVTNAGFGDVIEIGRQDRPSLYDIWVDRPVPLVPRELRLEVGGRLDARGEEIEPAAGLPEIPGEVAAVAVCLLHADLDPAHEQAVAAALEEQGFDVSCSSDVSPEFREYERTVTTVVNAYLRPVCRPYLGGLDELADEALVMTSAGGLVSGDEAARLPAALLLSGPAGGVRAGAAVAAACGYPDAVTFDMGGTSTDVCLVRGGVPEPAPGREVAGLPVRLPSLDIHTIGAGGGSIARLDPGGALVVGPESAGADPGPACYGRGGTAPTVTDADLVLGRIPVDAAFSGLGRLDSAVARKALSNALGAEGQGSAEELASGVVAVVDAAMEQAVRAVTVERGVDPAGLALVAFGGAGPLHACALAEALGMRAVIVPPRAGVLSAVGLLCSPRQRELVRSWPDPSEREGLEDALAVLGDDARTIVAGIGEGSRANPDIEVEYALDCRYRGQSHELTVPSIEEFHAEHERRNGYSRPEAPVEVVALRARARRPAPLDPEGLPLVERRRCEGPTVAIEADCTVWIPEGWVAEPGALGAWILTRAGGEPDPTRSRRGAESSAESAEEEEEGASLDPAALRILIGRLTGVADEMGAVLRRAAFSPNIKERADCSAALFTPAGELLAQAEHIPVHLGSMPASVAAAIDAFGDRVRPGDQIILNDPFAGGTHLNDITVVAPCFTEDGRLVGWAANRAHHADVGGMAPGSIPPEATEVYQEGLRIPPVLLTPEVEALLFANSRTGDERRGDLDAQRGANRVGVERLRQLADEALDEIVAYGERRMRAALADFPDGTWTFEDTIDSTGAGPDQRQPARIALTLRIDGETATFDFTGTDEQRAGNVNAVEAVTISAVSFALRSATDPTIPANGGAMRPVSIVAPGGTLVAARPPAAVGAGNVEVSQRVADVCFGALAQACPDRVAAAGQGTMNNLLIGGDGWVYYETIAGGQGARPSRTGMSGVHTGMTNTKNTPIEALERAYSLRVRRYRLRRGSGGRGMAPGGDGIERDLEVLEDCTISLITERRVSRPWGLGGGEHGAPGENWLLPAGDEAKAHVLPDKCTVHLRAGDVLRMLTPGGGGWGAPTAER
jgi:N-methylhydantoinase B/oxoprolinase/acetone carboxylase alpha subunit/N-methylhydantoinase A/oxoprolinase/acetone carboxylase beta subunit